MSDTYLRLAKEIARRLHSEIRKELMKEARKYIRYPEVREVPKKQPEERRERSLGEGLREYGGEYEEEVGMSVSCRDVLQYPLAWFVVGDKYIAKVQNKLYRADEPVITFRSGECQKELAMLGINEEGIYYVVNGQVRKKVFDLPF